MFGTSFANGPEHGIHDIRLPTTVGSHDRRDPLREGEMEAIHKGFESDHLKRFEFHEILSPALGIYEECFFPVLLLENDHIIRIIKSKCQSSNVKSMSNAEMPKSPYFYMSFGFWISPAYRRQV
jgi:hypothetical protein